MGSPPSTLQDIKVKSKWLPFLRRVWKVKDPNNAVIYTYRGWAQAMRTLRLYLDDNLVGESNNNSFFRIVSQPGTHKLTLTNVRNVALDILSFSTEADKVYYIEIKGDPIFVSRLT